MTKKTEYPTKPASPKDRQVGGDHYKGMAIQPGIFIRRNDIPWYEANAIKYICRHKVKGGRQDLEKAKHYIELALEEYDAEHEPNNGKTPPIGDLHGVRLYREIDIGTS